MTRGYRDMQRLEEISKEISKEREQVHQIIAAAENLRMIDEKERKILELERKMYEDKQRLIEERHEVEANGQYNYESINIRRQELRNQKDEIDAMKEDLRKERRCELTIDNQYVHAIATGRDVYGSHAPIFEEKAQEILGDELQELRDWVDGKREINQNLIRSDPNGDEIEYAQNNEPKYEPGVILGDPDDMQQEREALEQLSVDEQRLQTMEKEIIEEKKRAEAMKKDLQEKEVRLAQIREDGKAEWQQGNRPEQEKINEHNKLFEQIQRMRNQIADMTQGIEEKEIQAQGLREIVATQAAIQIGQAQTIGGEEGQEINLDDLDMDKLIAKQNEEIDIDELVADEVEMQYGVERQDGTVDMHQIPIEGVSSVPINGAIVIDQEQYLDADFDLDQDDPEMENEREL